MRLPKEEISYWEDSVKRSPFRTLRGQLTVDVVVIGGGIAGLTAAYLLKQAGVTVAVLEKNEIGSGTTGGTTGKVTSQHNLIYNRLYTQIGQEKAQLYGQANQRAIEEIEKIILQEKINCNWQRDDSYVFTTDPKRVKDFEHEVHIAQRLGLPASLETKLDLPFKVEAAVKFTNQAKFHSLKYVTGLAQAIEDTGGYVFEHSKARIIIDNENSFVSTLAGQVKAKHIVVATRVPTFPLWARFSYGLLEYPHYSYIVAGRMKKKLSGMYISPDTNHYSILPIHTPDEDMLLVGGEPHFPGFGLSGHRFQKLVQYASDNFDITSIDYKWRAMDYLAYDGIPLIGKLYPRSHHTYTATGFQKWGLTTSMVSGMIIKDLIIGHKNPWSAVFDSTRPMPIKLIGQAINREFSRK